MLLALHKPGPWKVGDFRRRETEFFVLSILHQHSVRREPCGQVRGPKHKHCLQKVHGPTNRNIKLRNCLYFPKISPKVVTGMETEASPCVFGYHCGDADACPGMSVFSSSPCGVQLHRATTASWSLTQRTPSSPLGTRSTPSPQRLLLACWELSLAT